MRHVDSHLIHLYFGTKEDREAVGGVIPRRLAYHRGEGKKDYRLKLEGQIKGDQTEAGLA
jgi:hypothetical protein